MIACGGVLGRKLLLSFQWFGIVFLSAYCMNNEKGINKEKSLTHMLVDRKHNEKIEGEMNHNDSSTGNIFHWSLITHLML